MTSGDQKPLGLESKKSTKSRQECTNDAHYHTHYDEEADCRACECGSNDRQGCGNWIVAALSSDIRRRCSSAGLAV